jgi:2',3'-cyclic-nucleotide 2'-phosphodiesterase (5'-nucleotidase family)
MPSIIPTVQGFDFHVFVQLNDVYFLDARADYSRPGGLLLPRIATMIQRLKRQLPGKVTVCVPGDFLAPSCLGKLSTGQHMVDVFNSIGVDLVTFGNHEFEQPPLTPATLAQNIAHSNFTWLCANFEPAAAELRAVFDSGTKVKPYAIVRLRDGLVAGLFGMTLADTYPPYGRAAKPMEKAREVIATMRRDEPYIRAGADELVLIAMTHQDAADDVQFARRYPELLLVMGGHDHDEDYVIDQYRPMIVKAASNARTIRFNVLVHRPHRGGQPHRQALWLDTRSLVLNRAFDTLTYEAVHAAPVSVQNLIRLPGATVGPTEAERAFIDDTRLRSGIVRCGAVDIGLYSFAMDTTTRTIVDHIPEDPETRQRIDYWEACWDRRPGASRTPILVLPRTFHARDGDVRRTSTNIGNLAADALRIERSGNPGAHIGLLNAGALRIDRDLLAGETITARTICDLLFFDNTVQIYTLSGRELWRILEQSLALRSAGGAEGHGDFLQISGLKALYTDGQLVRVMATSDSGPDSDFAADDGLYPVATTDYVATISKHYKAFFAGKAARTIGAYHRMFDVALRRLGAGSGDERYDHLSIPSGQRVEPECGPAHRYHFPRECGSQSGPQARARSRNRRRHSSVR